MIYWHILSYNQNKHNNIKYIYVYCEFILHNFAYLGVVCIKFTALQQCVTYYKTVDSENFILCFYWSK